MFSAENRHSEGKYIQEGEFAIMTGEQIRCSESKQFTYFSNRKEKWDTETSKSNLGGISSDIVIHSVAVPQNPAVIRPTCLFCSSFPEVNKELWK